MTGWIVATAAAMLGGFVLLRFGFWRALLALAAVVRRARKPVSLAGSYVRAHPLLASAAVRYPRLTAFAGARLRRDAFTGLPLTLLLAGAVYLAALFAGLLEELYEARDIIRFDVAVDALLDAIRFPPLLQVFRWLTDLGSAPAMVAVGFVATSFFLTERRLRFVSGLWAAVIGAHVTTWTGKYAIGRARPEFLDIAQAAAPSFPSAHATAALAVYGFLAYAVVRRLASMRLRFEVVYWTCVLIALIGFSRIYLRVHFASDVVSGFIVGAFWLLVGIAVAEWPRRVTSGPTRNRSRA